MFLVIASDRFWGLPTPSRHMSLTEGSVFQYIASLLSYVILLQSQQSLTVSVVAVLAVAHFKTESDCIAKQFMSPRSSSPSSRRRRRRYSSLKEEDILLVLEEEDACSSSRRRRSSSSRRRRSCGRRRSSFFRRRFFFFKRRRSSSFRRRFFFLVFDSLVKHQKTCGSGWGWGWGRPGFAELKPTWVLTRACVCVVCVCVCFITTHGNPTFWSTSLHNSAQISPSKFMGAQI